jgi:hypothetical protein
MHEVPPGPWAFLVFIPLAVFSRHAGPQGAIGGKGGAFLCRKTEGASRSSAG